MEYRAVVLTISDRCSRGIADDRSGPAIIERLPDLHAQLIHREILPDDIEPIRAAARTWLGRCDLLLTTGGTGIAPRDVTPEALEPLIERTLPGFGEAMRSVAFASKPTTVLSRAGAGVSGSTLVAWLPGAPAAIGECLEALAPAIRHACKLLHGEQPH